MSVDSLLADLPLLLFRARVAADLLEHVSRVRFSGATAKDIAAARAALAALANTAEALATEVRRRNR